MRRVARLIWIDEIIWTQFQALYPRQASKILEETLRSMINLKIEVSDEQIEQMRKEKGELQEQSEKISGLLKEHDLKIQAWESRKKQELTKEKRELEEEYKRAKIEGEAIRASGILEKVKL